MSDAGRPLAGVRVLDFSRLLPGPYCTLLLSRLGADVVKVEDVVEGDPMRRYGSPVQEMGSLFAYLNGGKRSISLDLKQPRAQHIAQDLAATSDVVVEGFRPGVATRLGIDFPTLAARNSRLVYCSLSGYGQRGQLSNLPGHDLTYAAVSGLLDALFPDRPHVPGVQLVDAAGALLATVRILAALHAAHRRPQYLDVSLYEGARALMPAAVVEALSDRDSLPLLDILRGSERNDVYRCADGRWLAVTPLEDAFWQRLRALLEREGFLEPGVQPTSRDLHDIFRRRASDDWYVLLSAADVPCAPVRSTHQAERDPAAHDDLDRSEGNAPALGEHTAMVLEELGCSAAEIADLHGAGVIRTAAPH